MNTVEALADFKQYKPKLNQELPELMKHLDALFQASLVEGALSTKQKELIVLGIAVATHCEPCILVHASNASTPPTGVGGAATFQDFSAPRAFGIRRSIGGFRASMSLFR